ncbi:uncharacterized protein LOC130371259 isoform X2 [Gadus chalcogrammus]|uniref:uncharacterized protein LOC130371259 isoform X2 n=1 Tax=Gadus chalcogrammus TaxID=1042646 RepID=UPI0024C4AE85|nr:uncharacterized protein LOC130371259 isoform X2 [Gadus chalcogrammus]
MRFDQPRHHHIRNSAASLPHSDTGHLHLQPRCVTRRRSKFPQLTIHDTIYACFESDEDISIVKKQLFVRLHELTSAIQLLSTIAARRISKSAMDEQSALIRAERTFWNVWNYISGAVTRLLRAEPAVNNPGNAERTGGQTVGFERAQRDPSQRDDKAEEEEKNAEEEKKEEEEQADLNTASLPHCPQPPLTLPSLTDGLLRGPGGTREVQCTAVSTRGSGIHGQTEQEDTDGVQWFNQTERERTEKGCIKFSAATQQIDQENYEKLLEGRSRAEESKNHQKQQQQQDTETSNYPDEENDNHHSGLVEEVGKALAADRPEEEAGQYCKVTEVEEGEEEEKEEEEEEDEEEEVAAARVSLSSDEEPDLNEPNNVSGSETEGHDIVREENLPFVNKENLSTEGGDTQKKNSPNLENTDGGSAEPCASTLTVNQSENNLKSIEAVLEQDLTGIVSDEDDKVVQEITISDFLTPFVDTPEANLSSPLSNDGNAVVGQERLEVESKQRSGVGQFEMKEQSSFLIQGSNDLYRKGSNVIGPVGNQIVVATKEEITKEGVTAYVEEKTPVKNDADAQNDESQPQEEVNQRGEEEGGAEVISLIHKAAQDKELSYSLKTEAVTEFNSPEPLLGFGDAVKHDTKDSPSASSDEDGDDGEGGVSTQWPVGIDSPGVALLVKTESNNEQEMSAALPDIFPGTSPGSGAGLRGLSCRLLIPEVYNGDFAAATENTEEIALMGRDSDERWVASQLPNLSEGFKYVAGVGEVDHIQREDHDTTLKSGEREDTVAGQDMVDGWSVDPESLGDRDGPWGVKQQMSGRAVGSTGEEGRTGDGLSDEDCSRHEAHKTDVEDFKTEEPLFEFKLDGERSESTGAASKEAVALDNIVLRSVWYDEVNTQDDRLFCEEILILPHNVIQKTTEPCEGESTAATMTEENKGRTPSQSEDYIEPESIHQPIDNQVRSFDDGQTKTEDIVKDISDEETGIAGLEETTESKQQRKAGESDLSVVETVGPGSLTDISSDLLMDIRQDLPAELQESTSGVTEPQTRTSAKKIEERVEVVSAVKAAEDEQALTFGQATGKDEEILGMGVLHKDTDHTLSVPTKTENQAVLQTEIRTPSSSSSSSSSDDDDDDDEAADQTHETTNHPTNFEEQIQDQDEMKEMSTQIEGEEDEELPLDSYSYQYGLAGTLGKSDILEAQDGEDSENISGRESMPDCEVLTTKPEGIRLPEMLMTVHLDAPDVSPPSFIEGRTPSQEKEPQHHHLPPSGKLSDDEAVSSQAEHDESLEESQMNEEAAIKMEAINIYPEVSAFAMSYDGATEDGSYETPVIPVPIPNSVDEDSGVEDTSRLLPDVKLSDASSPPEVDSVVLREKKGFGESRQGPCLDSKHPSYKILLKNQARSRRSEFIAPPVLVLSAEERARQRHSLPPGTFGEEFELDVNVLDLTVQKYRILVKNPSTRRPTDPRALLQMPSLEAAPSQRSNTQQALPLAGRPMGGIGVGIKLPGFGGGFPALKKTQRVVKGGDEVVPEQSEPQEGQTISPKPTVAERKPRWTPPKQPGFGNPLMSELKSKLKKTSEE